MSNFIHGVSHFCFFHSLAPLGDDVFMLKIDDPRVGTNGLKFLIPMIDLLAGLINDVGFFAMVCKSGFDPLLAYVAAFRRGEAGEWSCTDLEGAFFLNRWRTSEVICLADKRVHKHDRKVGGQTFSHELRLPSIAICFKFDVLLSSFDDVVRATQEASGD